MPSSPLLLCFPLSIGWSVALFCSLSSLPLPSHLLCSGVLGREDLTKEDLGLLKNYYEESFGFPYLLDLGGTIRAATDLGDLW